MELIYLSGGCLSGIVLSVLFYQLIIRRKTQGKLDTCRDEMNREKNLRISLETKLEERSNAWDTSIKALKETFDALAANALKSNNQAFLGLAGQTMENYLNLSKGELSRQQQSMEFLLKPLKESLDKHETLTKAMETSTKETFGGIKTYIEYLKEAQVNLTRETSALVSALKNPRVRGRWGEIGLKRIIEFSGMTKYCHFSEQESVQTEENKLLRPDMVIHLPGDRTVVVDSKVPLNAYLESLEQDNDDLKKELSRKHAQDVREHMKKLGSKSYWSQFDNSVDFVILYIEIEPALSAALSMDAQMLVDSLDNKVIFSSPTTLITVLRTIAFSWKQNEMAENAKKIAQSGKELFDRLCIFSEHYSALGKNLDNAIKSFNTSIGSWENRILPSARRLRELGVDSEKKELIEITEIDVHARELTGRE